MRYPNSGRIATYSVILGKVFYWDIETNDFTLMEAEPGILIRVDQFPNRDGKFVVNPKQK
jgi:hypothetical protein